jgi:cation diffusion facilitator family transporter
MNKSLNRHLKMPTYHSCRYLNQLGAHNQHHEQSTLQVIILTVLMMVIEIVAGIVYGSMALLADGCHMGTHAAAISITLFTYRYARYHSHDPRYSFGTGKVGVLGGFASAILLAFIAVLVGVESLQRLFSPQQIQFNEALIVAVVGLVVNLVSAVLLQEDSHHETEGTHLHDHNLKAAYMHVLADALTSVLAIAALLIGKVYNWIWLDAVVGLLGAAVILRWSYDLLRDTSQILLDSSTSDKRLIAVRELLETQKDSRVLDLHIWQLNAHQCALIVSIETATPRSPDDYKALLSSFRELVHITVEVNSEH